MVEFGLQRREGAGESPGHGALLRLVAPRWWRRVAVSADYAVRGDSVPFDGMDRQGLRIDGVAVVTRPVPVRGHPAEPGWTHFDLTYRQMSLSVCLPAEEGAWRGQYRSSVTKGSSVTRLVLYAPDGAVAAMVTQRGPSTVRRRPGELRFYFWLGFLAVLAGVVVGVWASTTL